MKKLNPSDFDFVVGYRAHHDRSLCSLRVRSAEGGVVMRILRVGEVASEQDITTVGFKGKIAAAALRRHMRANPRKYPTQLDMDSIGEALVYQA
jgi:MOSC domain-containing protein YiiM